LLGHASSVRSWQAHPSTTFIETLWDAPAPEKQGVARHCNIRWVLVL
jgi:hypothetical protein